MHIAGARSLAGKFTLAGMLSGSVAGIALPSLESLSVPEGPDSGADYTRPPPRAVIPRIGRAVIDLSNAQRGAVSSHMVRLPPGLSDGASSAWLPIIRVGDPPRGEVVVPQRRPLLTLEPMPINTVNMQVAESLGNNGMVFGITIAFP